MKGIRGRKRDTEEDERMRETESGDEQNNDAGESLLCGDYGMIQV